MQQARLFSVRAAPTSTLMVTPEQEKGNSSVAPRTHDTCLVADATYAFSSGLGAVGARDGQDAGRLGFKVVRLMS